MRVRVLEGLVGLQCMYNVSVSVGKDTLAVLTASGTL